MQVVEGHFYEASSSRRIAAALQVAGDGAVIVEGDGSRRSAHVSEVRVSPRARNAPRFIYLPDGATFETRDNDGVDRAFDGFLRSSPENLSQWLESRWTYVGLTLAVVAGSVWWFVVVGIPLLAHRTAEALPLSLTRSVSTGALQVLDRTMFDETKLPESTRQRLQQRFRRMLRGVENEDDFVLHFRSGKRVGPNAFALPSGSIILTDEIVELAANDDEIVSVLAHEIGHVVHRHGLRQTLQSSVVALLVVSVTGDASALTSVTAGLPTMLANASYSRGFETEADDYALEHLRRSGPAPACFADLLDRLPSPESQHEVLGYLSTHPSSAERSKKFRRASGNCTAISSPPSKTKKGGNLSAAARHHAYSYF